MSSQYYPRLFNSKKCVEQESDLEKIDREIIDSCKVDKDLSLDPDFETGRYNDDSSFVGSIVDLLIEGISDLQIDEEKEEYNKAIKLLTHLSEQTTRMSYSENEPFNGFLLAEESKMLADLLERIEFDTENLEKAKHDFQTLLTKAIEANAGIYFEIL